ncbi:MAG TPA: hypothetical protein VFQ65_00685, partial [Kofleriaceae bacterium]|nr:hypothetical protein [Kofleriaceae bacterium]
MKWPALVVLAACGPKPAPQWVERDGAQQHHETSSSATPTARPIDLSKLSPATIDELDEATAIAVVAQLDDKAPAARVALRAARLAHHRGDDAVARAVLARAGTAADAPEVAADVTALARELVDIPVKSNVVAVLLPLTGRYGGVGGELRTAIELAP